MTPKKFRLLCVEDDTDTCTLLSSYLAQHGYEFVLAKTYAEGLRLSQTEQFDLYLLDERLPDGSGVELAQQIRQIDPYTPIVFQSANAFAQDIRRGLDAGAQAYLTKPYDFDVLVATVKGLLTDQHKEQLEDCLPERDEA